MQTCCSARSRTLPVCAGRSCRRVTAEKGQLVDPKGYRDSRKGSNTCGRCGAGSACGLWAPAGRDSQSVEDTLLLRWLTLTWNSSAERPRAQLPGGSGIGPLILAQSRRQVTLQLSARQPGQLQRVVGLRALLLSGDS